MYLVYKLDINTNLIHIVNHADNFEDAQDLIKKCADDFMTEENRKFFDQTENTKENQSNIETTYILKTSTKVVGAIDVVKKEMKKSKGWTGTFYKTTFTNIAQFYFTKYDHETENKETEY